MKIRNKAVAAAILCILMGASHAEDSKPSSSPTKFACPERLDGFENGKATAEQIKGCLGPPHYGDHNPDGRFVYLYNLKNGITVTYLFDAGGVLTRMSVYKKN